MKKVLLTLALFGFGACMVATAQCNNLTSSYITIPGCVSGCFSVHYGSSLIDYKPTDSQYNAIVADLRSRCSTFSGRANILAPGTL